MMMKQLLAAAGLALCAAGSAGATPMQVCGSGAASTPYDLATGAAFECNLLLTGAAAINGSVVLDFESSRLLDAVATARIIGGSGTTFTRASLEWFDKPSNVSLGAVNLTDLGGDGFGGSLTAAFTGPILPDEQYIILNWAGFSSDSGDASVFIEVSEVLAPVPVPAAGLMLLTAVGGLLAFARRRKARSG